MLLLHDPHAVSAGLVATRLGRRVPLVAVRRVDFPLRGAFSRAKYARLRPRDRGEPRDRRGHGGGRRRARAAAARLRGRPRPPARARAAARRSRELGVPEGAPVVGNVAALTGHKDHATLLEAMALLRAAAAARPGS